MGILLESGADVDAQANNGTTALMASTGGGHTETVRALLAAGAAVSLQKRSGASAMTIAASKGQTEIADLLAHFVIHGTLPVEPEAAESDPKELGAELIASARNGDSSAVRNLLGKGAPLDHRTAANETALIVAAEGGHKETLEELLFANPDLDLAKEGDGVRIFIGSENKLFSLSGSTLVISPYMNAERKLVGAIGVIGPTRLNYGRIVPIVDYTAQLVGRLLSGSDQR